MKIEKIKEQDFQEIISLIKAEFPYISFNVDKVKERLSTGRIFLFKAAEKQKLLGFIEIELLEGKVARINGLTVKEEFRNKGIAKKLLDYAVEFLKKKSMQRILLLVKEKNAAAKKVYNEAGFSFIGMYRRELDGAVVEEMEFDLKPEKGGQLSYVG
jgi:ribosomal-protein-alanine N-acetyltransferase